MSVPADDELAVACPRCTAAAGEPCETPSGAEAKGPHAARVKAAERAVELARRRAASELPEDRITEHRWRRVWTAARAELEQRGAWTKLAAEQLEQLVRNMAAADNARTAAELQPTLEGSMGQTVANPMFGIALKLDAQALITARTLKLTPDTRGTSATVEDNADDDPDAVPEERDALAALDELARHKAKKAASGRR